MSAATLSAATLWRAVSSLGSGGDWLTLNPTSSIETSQIMLVVVYGIQWTYLDIHFICILIIFKQR